MDREKEIVLEKIMKEYPALHEKKFQRLLSKRCAKKLLYIIPLPGCWLLRSWN